MTGEGSAGRNVEDSEGFLGLQLPKEAVRDTISDQSPSSLVSLATEGRTEEGSSASSLHGSNSQQ